MKNSDDKNKLYQEFCIIVEFIVSLVKSLFRRFLLVLLNIFLNMIALRFQSLQTVLRIFSDLNTSIRTLYLSFNKFLLSDQLQSKFFEVNNQATHCKLFFKCLRLLSEFKDLQKNLCKLEYSDKSR